MLPSPEQTTPSGLTIKAAIYLHFKETFTDMTPADADFWKVCGRLNRVSKPHIDSFCKCTGLDRTRLICTLVKFCERNYFGDPQSTLARFPELRSYMGASPSEEQPQEQPQVQSISTAVVQPSGSTIAVSEEHQIDSEACHSGPQPDIAQQGPESHSPENIDEEPMGPTIVTQLGYRTSNRYASVFDLTADELAETSDLEDAASSTSTLISERSSVLAPVTIPNPGTTRIPDLFPIYLPYPAQHSLLTSTQKILEQSCHAFVKYWSPKSLLSEGFTHPENAELPKWIKLIMIKLPALPARSIDRRVLRGRWNIGTVTESLSNLRHTAVHRLKISSNNLKRILESAIVFAKFLKDDDLRVGQLRRMLGKATDVASELESGKRRLQADLEKELLQIKEAREELDRLEQMLLVKVWVDDKALREVITFDIEDVLAEPEPEISIVEIDGTFNIDIESGMQEETQSAPSIGESFTPSSSSLIWLGNHWHSPREFLRRTLDVESVEGDDIVDTTDAALDCDYDGLETRSSMEMFYLY